MSERAILALALFTASAFSSLPSAFYATIADTNGLGSWSTALLFAVHGAAAMGAMTVVGLPRSSAVVSAAGLGTTIGLLLAADALAGLLLVFAAGPAEFWMLLTGRAVTGAALGAVTPVLAASLTVRRSGTEITTAGVLGGVGLGSLLAGSLALAGVSRPSVFAIGCAGVAAVAVLVRVRLRGRASQHDSDRAPASPDDLQRSRQAPSATVLVAAALAFTANGVLGLFTSLLPGAVADLADAQLATFVAGLTAGIVLLCAGLSRLVTARITGGRAAWLAAMGTATGAVAFAGGLAAGIWPLALAGGMLLGAAAGFGYDLALRLVSTRLTDSLRLSALARVQRGGQFGLVAPVLLYPIALAR
jgi:hypothetical protein